MAAFIRRAINKMSDRQINNLVIGFLLLLFAGAGAVSLVAYGQGSQPNLWEWVDGFAQNFGTEMFGAFLTFLLFDRLVGERQKRRETEERFKRDQANAISRWRRVKTKEDRGAILDEMRVNDLLREAFLPRIELPNAFLHNTNLHMTNLHQANLSEANLIKANLSRADLREANLCDARLHSADLSEADLQGAILKGAKQITCEQLQQAWNLEGATLPDGTKLPGRTDEEIYSGEPESFWREAFEVWCKTVPVDKDGYIIVD